MLPKESIVNGLSKLQHSQFTERVIKQITRLASVRPFLIFSPPTLLTGLWCKKKINYVSVLPVCMIPNSELVAQQQVNCKNYPYFQRRWSDSSNIIFFFRFFDFGNYLSTMEPTLSAEKKMVLSWKFSLSCSWHSTQNIT